MKRLYLVALAIALGMRSGGAAERWQATVASSGRVELALGRDKVASVTPGLFEADWRMAEIGGGKSGADPNVRRGEIRAPGGAIVDCELRPSAVEDGIRLAYRLTARSHVALNSLHVAMDLPIALIAGGSYVADGAAGAIPAEFKDTHIRSGTMKSLTLALKNGAALSLDFATPTQVLLQDNRRWGPTFSVRIGPSSAPPRTWLPGESLEISFTLSAKEGISMEIDSPVTIEEGPEWIPLAPELDVEPGSALDFSKMGWLDAPAGKHGWLTASPKGHFEFEKRPGKPQRFYGVNLCFSAHYITHDEADKLAERLARIGYNAVRFHHYEGELVDRGGAASTALKPDKLDQLDYLFAALKKRGIYVSTDLFVSRRVLAKEIWDGANGDVAMDDFKMLIPVNERAFDNWKAFSGNLLTHVNPYTGVSYAKDPALAWLSMINEGNCGNFIDRVEGRIAQDWQNAWNKWLLKRYGSRQALETAWGAAVPGSPEDNSVPLARNPYEDSPKGRDLVVFLAETEQDMFRKMKTFLRDHVGTRALLTNDNSWTNPVQYQAVRAQFDYVDDHFYVDHPQFIEQSWRLPSRCENTSPAAGGAQGGRRCMFTRLLGKPFTITEYNYSGPGRFRGVGGIITGCMAALQQWDGVWRFAYSHSRDNLFKPGAAGYFDLASDALNQAAERAVLCIYLRGDMKPAPHAVAIAMTQPEIMETPKRNVSVAPAWHALGLVTRVGTYIGAPSSKAPADIILTLGWSAPKYSNPAALSADPYSPDAGAQVFKAMKSRGWLAGNVTDLSVNRIQSETGELLIDAPRDVLAINTPMTAGGYAPQGETIEAGPVRVRIEKTDATVWVSSLDGKTIPESRRLLIFHLTDLQNSGARFAEKARKTLLEWGKPPHLVLVGSATIAIGLKRVKNAKVWALATSGRRVAEVQGKLEDGCLAVPLNVAGPEGVRMIYEIQVE